MKRIKPLKRTPLKRRVGRYKAKARKALPRVSKKRAALNEVAGPWREAFAREIGRCELCRDSKCGPLDCHEITGGWARRLTLMNRSCIVVLGRPCHEVVELEPALWNTARQAALLRRRRPQDFSLSVLNAFLTRKLDLEEVDLAARMLSDQTTVGRRQRRTA